MERGVKERGAFIFKKSYRNFFYFSKYEQLHNIRVSIHKEKKHIVCFQCINKFIFIYLVSFFSITLLLNSFFCKIGCYCYISNKRPSYEGGGGGEFIREWAFIGENTVVKLFVFGGPF